MSISHVASINCKKYFTCSDFDTIARLVFFYVYPCHIRIFRKYCAYLLNDIRSGPQRQLKLLTKQMKQY